MTVGSLKWSTAATLSTCTDMSQAHRILPEGLFVTRAEWMESAACKGKDVDLFFSGPGMLPVEALRLCQSCPVRVDCLSYAVDNHIDHGMWGGLSARERRHRCQFPVIDTRTQMFSAEARRGIVHMYERGFAIEHIARQYECSVRTVHRVLNRERAS